jgi:two-component system nitrogen regulation response regulator NtrX
VPALRDRIEDLPALARHFLERASQRFGWRPKQLSAEALEALRSYRWPGNVRELRNLIERLMILCPDAEIGVAHLPAEFRRDNGALPPGAPLRDARDDFERRYILAALKRHRGNVKRTAEALDLERSHLYRKLRSYGIEVERE